MPVPIAHAIGVDVGGTKIAAAVVDTAGRVLSRRRRASPRDDPGELLRVVAEVACDLAREHEVDCVGIGGAGFLDADRQRFYFSPHLEWGTAPVAEAVADLVGLPTYLENDANAAAWAEYRWGAGRGGGDQLFIAIGTGIGGGLIIADQIYRGRHGAAAEYGHLSVVPQGRPCECGRRGCLEQYVSGSALQRDARRRAAEGLAPGLLAVAGTPERLTGRMVTALARAEDADAVELFTEQGRWLGLGLATLTAVLDPGLVVVGGGVSAAGELLLAPTRAALREQLPGSGRHPGPRVEAAAFGNDAALLGAADLARSGLAASR